jgi:hypothetical protein
MKSQGFGTSDLAQISLISHFRGKKGLWEISNLGGVRDIRDLDPGTFPIEFRMSDPGVLRDLAKAILQIDIDQSQALSEKRMSPVTEELRNRRIRPGSRRDCI